MDEVKFKEALNKTFLYGNGASGIGTFKENAIHAVLKEYYSNFYDNKEVQMGKYVADIVNPSKIIEIQTQSFYRLKDKLKLFIGINNVEVVYPIITKKTINWINPKSGEIKESLISPKHGKKYDIFEEIYQIKELLKNPKLSFRLVLLDIVENRLLDGDLKKKKWNSTRMSKLPQKINEEIIINNLYEFTQFIPKSLPEVFTTWNISKSCKIRLELAQKMANVLCYLEVISKVSTEDKFYKYKRNYSI